MTYNAAAWLVDRHVAAGDGDRLAVVCGDRHLTYAELQQQVWRAQNSLAALGVRRTERIAMVVDDEPGWLAWFLGALRSGIVPVPLSTMLTNAELTPIVDDAVAHVVVASARHADKAGATVVIDADDWSGVDDRGLGEMPVAPTKDDSPAFWLYSSGTTGMPKGVMHRHANLEATARCFGDRVLGIRPDDRFLCVPKLFFAYGLGSTMTFAFAVGGTAILNPDPSSPLGLAKVVESSRPTMLALGPGFIAGMLDAGLPADLLSSVRVATSAGESLPADLHRRFTEHFGVPLLDALGTTEVLHCFLANEIGRERPGTSGTPVPGYDLELRNDEDAVVTQPDVPGFLHVRGPSIATGYWSRTEATQTAFRGDWLKTGDVYTRSADNYWTFLGRNSDMIKAGGIWVSPAEVESVLVAHADVLEAAVVGSRDASGLELVVAFVVPRAGHTVDAAVLEAHCREHMAAFKRPRQVVVVEALPKTATGKIRRFALRDALADSVKDTVPRAQ